MARPSNCTSKTKQGKRCTRTAVVGKKCRQHAAEKPTGRPSLIDKVIGHDEDGKDVTVRGRIVAAIGAGNYARIAAQSAGISEATYFNWIARGREWAGEDPEKVPDGERPYLEFFAAITRAEADAEVYAVTTIRKAMKDDWRAAVEYLRRRHRKRWKATESKDGEGGEDGEGLTFADLAAAAKQPTEED